MTTRAPVSRLGVGLRHGERVSPLELFFDLVFVLAITQCTALMAQDPTWDGFGRGLVVLGLLWWAWVGAGPLFIDTSGWRLVVGHFAERHGLILLVALGESIVAIGVGAAEGVDGGVIVAAVLGIGVACALWWAYFDTVAPAAAAALAQREPVAVRNEAARDGFSYLHLPLVAAIVLVALGMKSTLAHVGDALEWETATALAGGAALYLLALAAFERRSLGTLSAPRLVAAGVLLALVPVARSVDARSPWPSSPSCCGP